MNMWMVFVHCITSLIGASMGNTLPAIDRTCIIDEKNFPFSPQHWGEEGWRCTSFHRLEKVRRCIPLSFMCIDSMYGCGDGEESGEVCGGYGEQDRTCTNPITGEVMGWRCIKEIQRCIRNGWLCNGFMVCNDEEDGSKICGGYGEENRTCTNPVTGEALGWRCKSGRQQCISKRLMCDGEQDCEEGEDEGMVCGGYGELDRTCTNPVTREAVGLRWRADNQQCIHNDWLCDDAKDKICGGYGEQDRTCTHPFTGEAVGWRCRSGKQQCIRNDWICDGHQFCYEGEDEGMVCGGYGEQDRTCTHPITGEAVGWRCRSGRQQCIINEWRCDGEQDCIDGGYEGYLCGH